MLIIHVVFAALIILAYQRCIDRDGNPVDWFMTVLYPVGIKEVKQLEYVYVDSLSANETRYEYIEGQFPPRLLSLNAFKMIEWNTVSSKGFIMNREPNVNAFVMHTLEDLGNFQVNEPNSFFCISINDENAYKLLSSLDLIQIVLMYKTDNELMKRRPILKENTSMITEQITRLHTLEKQFMHLFTKTAMSNSSPFHYIIRNHYKESFYVKSNRKKLSEKLCDLERMVLNVNSVTYNSRDNHLSAEEDNSKWAVSIFRHTNCFSDLNFDEESKSQGGMTICFQHLKLSAILRKMITSNEECRDLFDDENC